MQTLVAPPSLTTRSASAPPALPSPLAEHLPALLWDIDKNEIDLQAMATFIIKRVIERGTLEDWAGMLSYYSKQRVQEVAQTAPYLSDAAILAVCKYFNIAQESLRCYQRKQSIPQQYSF